MAGRFPAAKLIASRLLALALAALLAACVNVTPRRSEPATPEAALALQARGLQRTVQEAAVAGATAGAGGAYLVGGRGGVPAGLLVGIPVGISAGTYVGFLQQRFATREARLERLRADIGLTNAETAAAIRTMRAVLGRQRGELAAIRAAGGTPAHGAEVAEAEASLEDMARAIDGAEKRQAEFGATRALRLVEGELTGVDAEIAELGARIAAMRKIAGTLAQEI